MLIQVSYGCAHNCCTFCTMYDDKQFAIRPLQGIYRDIQKASEFYYGIRSIFLLDGNALVVDTPTLLCVLNKIRELIPSCQRVAMYASFNDLCSKSEAELQELVAAGLVMVYVGLESGDASVLQRVKKDWSPPMALQAMSRAKAAGLEVHLSLILGLAGQAGSTQHIEATSALLRELRPEEFSCLCLSVQAGSELARERDAGLFTPADTLQLLQEERYLLERIDFPTFYWGNHSSLAVPKCGYLPEHQAGFVALMDEAIAAFD